MNKCVESPIESAIRAMATAMRALDPLSTMTVKEAAGLLHVSKPTVENYMRSGDLPTVTMGRVRRIRRSAIEDFLEMRSSRDFQAYTPGAQRTDVGHCPPASGQVDGSGAVLDDFRQGGGDNIPF